MGYLRELSKNQTNAYKGGQMGLGIGITSGVVGGFAGGILEMTHLESNHIVNLPGFLELPVTFLSGFPGAFIGATVGGFLGWGMGRGIGSLIDVKGKPRR